MNCSYRKTQSGKWAVCGPTSVVKVGATVTVTKKDGSTKTEVIEAVGKPFVRNGVDAVYGYPAAAKAARRDDPDRCLGCGGRLDDFDLRAAAVPGYHFDCV